MKKQANLEEVKVTKKTNKKMILAKYAVVMGIAMVIGFLIHNPVVFGYDRTMLGIKAATCNCKLYEPDEVQGMVFSEATRAASQAAQEATSPAKLKIYYQNSLQLTPRGTIESSFLN